MQTSPGLRLRFTIVPVCLLLAAFWIVSANVMTVCGQEELDLRRIPPIEVVAAPLETDTSQVTEKPAEASADQPEEFTETPSDDALDIPIEQVAEPASHWYDWAIPSTWQLPEVWDSSFELGIDGSEGNSTTLTFRSGAKLHRKVEGSDFKVSLSYVKSTAEYVETKHNAQLDAHHDWLFGESPWSLFAKSILVYDEFRPFDLEMTLNSGIGYRFLNTPTMTWKGRFGSGATRQFGGPNNTWRPEAMLGLDWEYKISDRQKFHLVCDYFPEWGDFESFRIRTDAGWEMLLDDATNMSLKLGVIDRYDSQAGGSKPNALDYSLLLLWKL